MRFFVEERLDLLVFVFLVIVKNIFVVFYAATKFETTSTQMATFGHKHFLEILSRHQRGLRKKTSPNYFQSLFYANVLPF